MDNTAKTVLIVDHNEDNRTVYRTILEHFGYRVIEARNGEDAVRMARDDHPDLMVIRRMIPLVDGFEATRMLKHDPGTSFIPVIAYSAACLPPDVDEAYAAGCDVFLASPFEPRRLVAEVERFIGAGREAR
jgi:two-component system cell cycle response regulator DivK